MSAFRLPVLCIMSIWASLQVYAQTEVKTLWSYSFGGNHFDHVRSMKYDKQGNLYLAGYYWAEMFVDTMGVSKLTSAGKTDFFILKLDQDRKVLWAKGIGGSKDDYCTAIDVDEEGNVLLTGSFSDVVDFDPGINVVSMKSMGASDVFVLKLSASGQFIWAKQFSGVSGGQGRDIAVDPLGNVYTTGWYRGGFDFDPGNSSFDRTSGGNWDMFITKLNTSGDFVWAATMGGPLYNAGYAIEVDKDQNVYTTGFFNGWVDMDPGNGVSLLAAEEDNIFVQKLNAQGNFVWAKHISSTSDAVCKDIVLDASGSIYVSGSFHGEVAGVNNADEEGRGIIAKLDTKGVLVWLKNIDGTGWSEIRSLEIAPSGNVLLTGLFENEFHIQGSDTFFDLMSQGETDVFLASITADGFPLWTHRIGGKSFESPYGIFTDSTDNVFVAGVYSDTLSTMMSKGFSDVFVQKVQICKNPTCVSGISEPVIEQEISVFPNPSNGTVYIDGLGQNDKSKLDVYDALGKHLFDQTIFESGKLTLPYSGVYFLRITKADGTVYTQTIVRE